MAKVHGKYGSYPASLPLKKKDYFRFLDPTIDKERLFPISRSYIVEHESVGIGQGGERIREVNEETALWIPV